MMIQTRYCCARRLSFRLLTPVVAATMALSAGAHGEKLTFLITLDGSQQTEDVDTAAAGTGTAVLDTDTNEFSWDISFTGLSSPETAAHFHGPAAICESAPPIITLPLGSPKVGSQILTEQQAADVQMGLWYVNIHTEDHQPGEIRGQVAPTPLNNPIPDPIAFGNTHVRLEGVAAGLVAPNFGTYAPGVPDRLFVTDQPGTLWNVNLNDGSLSVFLDVSDRLVDLGIFGAGSFDERGLLGVAFHPDYQQNGRLYTYTSEPVTRAADFSTMPKGATANHQTVIMEWQAIDPTDPDTAVDGRSGRELLRIDEPQFNHNAGALNFGHDGMLYISLGDGGAADDQDTGIDPFGQPVLGHGCRGNGAVPETILGSMLRIDPLGNNSANGQYGIPADNPFVGDDGVDEAFAFGFRNPFRFSVDQETGDIYVADVGQNDIEEVNVVVSGGNYGWNHKEGSFHFIPNGASPGYVTDRAQAAPDDLIDPIAEYDHDEGIAIIGGFVYRGDRIPALRGRYVFGEFAPTFNGDGRLFYLDESNTVLEFPLIGQSELGMFLLGMGQDVDGEVYVLANSTGTPFSAIFGPTGVIFRIAPLTGDMDSDGDVDAADLAFLLGNWGPTPPGDPAADLDGNGSIDPADLATLLGNWG